MSSRSQDKNVRYSSGSAKLQFWLLMCLFRIAVNRYLYGIFTRFLARFFTGTNAVLLTLPTGNPFKVYLNDAYWTRFALYLGPYEPEVALAVNAAEGNCDTFIDAGSNKGYWSVFAAPLFKRVVSIEAASDTYRYLLENTDTLQNVEQRHAAVFSQSDETLSFVSVRNSHASAYLGEAYSDQAQERVKTIAIDDILQNDTPALIKLDVEGAEIDALKGAQRAIESGSVLIYEDHGADEACETSAYLLGLDCVSVYSVQNAFLPLETVASVRSLKTDKYKGYNFVAARADSELLNAMMRRFANS